MNWDAIAAVDEVVGAIAVVATLLLIARDIRQNFRALSVAALRDTTARVQSFFDNVESYRSMVSDQKLDKDLDVLSSIVRRRIKIAGFAAWWQENTADYHQDFVAWIDNHHADRA